MVELIEVLQYNSNSAEINLIKYVNLRARTKLFVPTKVFSDDFITMVERNIKASKSIERDFKDAIRDINSARTKATVVKYIKRSEAIFVARDRLLKNFVPLLKKEYNKMHTIMKLLYAINKNIAYNDVKENFATILEIPYFNNFLRKELKNFHILRSILIHQETSNVMKSEHWVDILTSYNNITNALVNIMEQYIVPLNKKIDSIPVQFQGDPIMDGMKEELNRVLETSGITLTELIERSEPLFS